MERNIDVLLENKVKLNVVVPGSDFVFPANHIPLSVAQIELLNGGQPQ